MGIDIDESSINYISDGEPQSQAVFNRPTQDLIEQLRSSHSHTTGDITGLDDALAGKVSLSGNETIKGVKTFESFPVTPSAAPTADYQVANKKYVDDSASSSGIGVGQAWVNMTGMRFKGTTYTNTTGKPIQILVQYYDDGTIGTITFRIGNLSREVDDLYGGNIYPYWFSAIIPNGEGYSISGAATLPAWWELR